MVLRRMSLLKVLSVSGHGSRVTGHEREAQDGFTLLEVLVAVGVLSVIMVLLWSSTGQTLKAKDRFEARDLVYHQGRVALRKITDDLMMAFLTKVPTQREATSTAKPYATFFIGEDRSDQDSLRLTSFSHLRFFADAKESDMCKVSYEIAPSPEDAGVMNLIRRQQSWLDDTTEMGDVRAFVLAENIKAFDIEYFDERKDDWGKEWDTQKIDWRDKLPQGVRVSIQFANPDPDFEDEPINMSTAVVIPMSAGAIDL